MHRTPTGDGHPDATNPPQPDHLLVEFARLLRDERPETHEQDAALAWQLLQQARSAHPGTDPHALWDAHVRPHLATTLRAIEQTHARAVAGQRLSGAEQDALRTWLHGRAHHHLRHLRAPDADMLHALIAANPRWYADRQAEAKLRSLAGPDSAPTLDDLAAAAEAFEDPEHGWWRVAITIADQEETVDHLVAHAEATGDGPPGADLVRSIRRTLTGPDGAADRTGRPTENARRKAADTAANLPRHWRILLLAGPDTLLWVDLLGRSSGAHPWRPDGGVTAEEAETKVREHLAARLLDRDVTARPAGVGWTVHLEPLPDDLPGRLPVYLVRSRTGDPRLLDPGTADAVRTAH